MGRSNHREAEDRPSHPGAAVRPTKAAALRAEARHSSPIHAVVAEAAHRGRAR
jgi:hypothetical protein